MPGLDVPVPAQAVLPLETWEQPPRRVAGPAAAPVMSIAGFEGPLDWLLDLARRRRIDLTRLSIADLITAFEDALITALQATDKAPLLLARWGEWLVMAAELTLLRSRLLVPADAVEARAARDEAEQLRQTLLGRAAMGQAADWLDARVQVGREVFLRGATEGDTRTRGKRTGDITALLRACLAALQLPADAGARYCLPAPPAWSVLDAVARIRVLLPTLEQGERPLAAFLPRISPDGPDHDRRCRTAVSATFLASLELTRDGATTLAQETAWQTIKVAAPSAAVDVKPDLSVQ